MSTMKFTAWQDLDGNEIANAAYPPGLVLVKSQAIGTAVSSVTVSDVFSSAFDDYKVMVSGYTASGSTAWLGVRLDASHTSNYYGIADHKIYTGAASTFTANNGSYAAVSRNHNDYGKQMASFEVAQPYTSGVYTMISGVSAGWVGYSVFGYQVGFSTSFTGFQLFPDSGTLTGGTVRVYGYRN